MRMLRSYCVVGLACVATFATQPLCAHQTPQPLSVEAALHNVEIGKYDRPELSPDGKFLAYSTTAGPPRHSVTRRFEREVPLLPNGMLAALDGARLHVMEVATGNTLEVSAGGGAHWNPSFSPDSSQLAFFADAGGFPQLWVAELKTGAARRVSATRIFVKMWSPGDRAVWTHDGTGIFVVTTREVVDADAVELDKADRVTVAVHGSGAESVHTTHQATHTEIAMVGFSVRRSAIELLDVASGKARTLVAPASGPQPYAFSVSPSQRWIAYVSARSVMDNSYPLAVVSVAGGEPQSLGSVPTLVHDGPGPSSNVYTTAIHWTPLSDQLVLVRDGAYHLVRFSGGGPEAPVRLAPELGPLVVPLSSATGRFDQPTFTADGNTVVARLPSDESIVFAAIPLDGGAPRRIEIARRVGFRGLVTARGDVLWQPEPGTMLFNALDRDSGKRLSVKVALLNGRAITLLEDNATIDFLTSVSPRQIIASYSDAATPADLVAFDGKLRNRRRLTHVNPSLDDIPGSASVVFTTRVPSYDGSMRTLKTAVIFPVGYRSGDRPAALVRIYPHNEMSKYANVFGAGRLSGAELAQFWTTRGYAIVLPDLLPLTPASEGNGNMIRELADYLIPQLYRAADLGYIDIDRLVLTGHSAGGNATAALVTETSLFRAAVAYSCAPLDFFSTALQWWPQTVAAIGESKNPWSAFKQYLTNSPFHHADKIRTPIMLLHGTADSIPPDASQQMYRGLAQLGKTAQLALYEGEPHYIGEWTMTNAIDANQRVLDFVTRYVPAHASQKRSLQHFTSGERPR